MLSFEQLIAIAPNQTCIPITPEDHQAIQTEVNSTRYSNENARQQAYYNALSLRLLKPWIADMLGNEPPPTWIPSDQLPCVWDVVNGTAIQVNNSRLVIIPSGDRPFDELSVPQEWVDHPDWCGDYYLAIDIDTEQQWLRVAGYVPYQLLKQATFDDIDRTYCVDAADLIEDLNVLWIGQELLPNPKPVVARGLALGSETAKQLIAQLSTVKQYSPRLDIPFVKWSELITDDAYRQQLYEGRSGMKSKTLVVNLAKWFSGQFEQGWQSLQAKDLPVAIARSEAPASGETLACNGLVRLVTEVEPLSHGSRASSTAEYRVRVYAVLAQPLEQPKLLSLKRSDGDEDECVAQTPDDSTVRLLTQIGEAGEGFTVTVNLDGISEQFNFQLPDPDASP